jgi:type IV pilus assembly protein PilM
MQLGDWRKKVVGGAERLMNQLAVPIGIDFGAASLKLLQVSGADSPALIGAACVPTPDDLIADPVKRMAFQLEALPKLMRSMEFKGRRAVCSIPASHAYCKHFQLDTQGTKIAEVAQGTVAAQLGCDPSALVLRHVEVTEASRAGKSEVICMATARDLVERMMRALKDARLDPVGMHVEFSSMLRAFDSITRRIEDAGVTSLYLDIGAGLTRVVIAHGRDMVFARSIDLAGRHLDQAIARQTRLPLAQARTHRLTMADVGRKPVAAPSPAGNNGMAVLAAMMRREGADAKAGAAPTAVLADRRQGHPAPGHSGDLGRQARAVSPSEADLSEPLEILTDEISMCLRYHESVFPDRKIDRAIFIGGEARHLGLCQHIARTLRLPAQVADPMAGVTRTGREPCFNVDFAQPQPGWAATLGLCLSPTDL